MESLQYQKPIILECGYYHTDSIIDNKSSPRLVRDYEIDFNLSSGRTMWVDDIPYQISAGSVVCRRPGQKVCSAGVFNMYTLTLSYCKTTIPQNGIRNIEHTVQSNNASYIWDTIPIMFEPQHTSDISVLYRKLICEYQKCGQNTVCDLLVAQLLHQLLADAFSKQNAYSIQNSRIVDEAVQYMCENFERKILLNSLADYVHLDKSYFIRLFKKETGLTPIEYLNKIRIQQSRWYLINLDKTIAEISAYCGFSRSAYYISCFKKEYGLTPFQYRKKYSQNIDREQMSIY